MLSNIRKFLFIIPCMILGIFLSSGIETLAADAKLLDSNKVVIGNESKENTYYFSNSNVWELAADYDAVKSWDTYLKWRVIKPDGKATKWSSKDYYVDNKGKFTIGDYTSLSYTETVDVSSRISAAPDATYYIDIDYYGQLIFSWDQNKDETIKVIVSNSDDNFNFPSASISYDSVNNKVNVNASVEKDNKKYGIITNIKYFFSTESKDLNDDQYKFSVEFANSTANGNASFVPSSNVTAEIEGADSSYKYVYVMVTSGNGYSKIVKFDIANQVENENVNQQVPTSDQSNSKSGLFDYNFGELILLVLVVVLILSCALIITQKIVDYKKRLY